MPLVSINITRINAEKITSVLGQKITYTTMFNINSKKEASSADDEAVYEFVLSLNSSPPGVNITLQGMATVKFNNSKEYDFYNSRDDKSKVSLVAGIIFPQVYVTLLLLSKELQIPPPLMPLKPSKDKNQNLESMFHL